MTAPTPDPAATAIRTSKASLPLFVAAEAFSLFGNSAISIVLPWLVLSRTSGIGLDKIASLRQAVFSLAFLGGPALAGVLLAVLDPIHVVWVTAACSFAAGLCMLVLPLTALEIPAHDARPIGGWATIRASAALRAMLVIGFGSAIVVAPLLGVLLPAHFARLNAPTWFGATMSAFAVGSMIGAIAYAVLSKRSRKIVWVGGLLLQTIGMVGFTTLYGVWPVAIGSALVGVGSGLLSPVFIVFFTEQVAESVRGRVLGLFNALALIAAPLGLGAIAVALKVSTLEMAALGLLAAWIVVMTYAFVRHYHQLGLLPEPERTTQFGQVGPAHADHGCGDRLGPR